MPYKPVVLLILDGFGIYNEPFGNPVLETEKPNLDLIEKKYPFTTLQASSTAVGLPWGEAGNSEVGHLTIGAGRVVYHHLPRIIFSIHDKTFFTNPAFLEAFEHVRKNNSKLHLVGLISSGSVHSYVDHLYALLDLTKQSGLPAYMHVFTDGKDAPPNEAGKFIPALEERLEAQYPTIHVASVIGRTYSMDRDEKWDRIRKAYQLLTEGTGKPIYKASEYIKDSYKKDIFDSFIEPAFVAASDGTPLAAITDNDAVIFFNFREDSMREIVSVFMQDVFDHFPRKRPQNLSISTMTEYSKNFDAHVAFPPIEINFPLARVIGDNGLNQIHIAETEKYAHVTYFFNGGKETYYTGESWELVPSVQNADYDEAPAMKAKEIADEVIINIPIQHFILANFANADMVGHTGNFEALKKTIMVLDHEIGRVKEAVLKVGGVLIVTGDHGNAEQKINKHTGEILTEHTTNPVPFYLIGKDFERKTERTKSEITKERSQIGGILTDIAPTILDLLGLQKPDEMTGKDLLLLLKKQII